jgi:hypothetical protein
MLKGLSRKNLRGSKIIPVERYLNGDEPLGFFPKSIGQMMDLFKKLVQQCTVAVWQFCVLYCIQQKLQVIISSGMPISRFLFICRYEPEP